MNVIEIRNYLLKPNVLEHFIDYFEANFIVTQQDAGMPVLGQFRVMGEPEHFVFVRGFSDMQSRLQGLQSFYNGAVWEKYGAFPNDMMLEWHNVHLLRPLSNNANLTCGYSAETIAADLAEGTISPHTGMISIDFYQAVPGKRDALIEQFQAQVVPVYQRELVQVRGLFVAEMRENQFTRLPVIQNEDEFVVITAYESEAAYHQQRSRLTPHIQQVTGAFLSAAPETLLLSPTLRSPLRYG